MNPECVINEPLGSLELFKMFADYIEEILQVFMFRDNVGGINLPLRRAQSHSWHQESITKLRQMKLHGSIHLHKINTKAIVFMTSQLLL